MSAYSKFLLAVSLIASTFLPSFANAVSMAAQRCVVNFSPIEGRPVIFRDENGNLLGTNVSNSSDDSSDSSVAPDLQMPVSGSLLSSSIRRRGIDVSRLLTGSPLMQGSDGKVYIKMRMPNDTITSKGRLIPGGSNVLIAISDFYVSRALQPTGAGDEAVADAPCDPNLVNKFDNVLYTKGVTALTDPNPVARPQASSAVDQTPDDVPQPGDPHGVNEVGEEVQESPVVEKIISPKLPSGSEYPKHFLSSPTCNCTRGVCGITSRFGYRERPKTPNGYGSANHQGIDIGGGFKTRIVAAASGRVNAVGWKAGFGYSIVIDHGNGWQTQYSHLKTMPVHLNGKRVKQGEWVARGEMIGLMGSTGRSNGPHLHFGVMHGIYRVNPVNELISTTGASISKRCDDLPDYSNIDREMAQDIHVNYLGVKMERSSSRGAQ